VYARTIRWLWGPWMLFLLTAGVYCLQAAESELPSADTPAEENRRPGLLILEDPPQPLVPKQPRTEAEEDRLEALALFAAGRMLERKNRRAEALQRYQRAWRYDPEASHIARAVIHLAFLLRRHDEAARVALQLEPDELKDTSHQILRFLGIHLTRQGDWARALKLYERAVAVRGSEKPTGDDVLLQMEMGRLYHLIDQYDKAADSFALVVRALENPREFELDEDQRKLILLEKPALTYALFGECFLRTDRLDEAEAAFRKSHEAGKNDGLLQYRLAQVLAHRKQPAKALAALQVYFEEHLTDEGLAPYELLAELLEDLGRKDDLIEELEKLHGDNPKNVPLGYFLAEKYHETGKLQKAELLYLALVKNAPTTTGYRALAKIYREAKRPEQLLDVLGQAAGITGTLQTLGPLRQEILDDDGLLDTLIDIARKKHESDPDSFGFGHRLAVGLLALQAKRFDAAGEFLDLAVKARPKEAAQVLLAWGVGLLVADRPGDAAEVFQRALDQKALPEENPIFHSYLARALAMNGRTDEALAAARKAVELDEDAPRYHGLVAWVLFDAKRYDEARKAFVRLIEEFDSRHDSPEIRETLREARLTLSHLCVLADDLPRAEEWLEQVLDEFPDDVGASNDLGYLWADQGRHLQRALKMIRLAVEAQPDNLAYRDSLGWVFYRLGRFDEAVAELEKAAVENDNHPPDAVILDHLGDAYLKTGQVEKAKNAWRRAVKLFRQQEEPEKAKTTQEKIKSRT